MDEYFLVGTPPVFNETIMEQLLLEVITQTGPSDYSSLLVYLYFDEQWWKTFSDGPQLYWREVDSPPSEWESLEHGLAITVRNLGKDLQLCGQRLHSWFWGVSDGAPSLSLTFGDGRQLTFKGDPWSGFALVKWHFSS